MSKFTFKKSFNTLGLLFSKTFSNYSNVIFATKWFIFNQKKSSLKQILFNFKNYYFKHEQKKLLFLVNKFDIIS